MTDQTIPADAVRDIIAAYRDGASHRGGMILDALKDLLPAPPRPTLADMTEEERAACQWMQAEVHDMPRLREGVLVRTDQDCGYVLDSKGETWFVDHAKVTPRPGLPRMEWPGDQKPEEVTPVKVGDVIESADDPRLAALPAGSILVDRDGGAFEVTKADTGEWGGIGYVPSQGTGTKWGPWTVRRIGKEADQ
ncbi:hypothetical protein [Microbacterium sp.]|uniref:hypothetical protein n=1 Tax=Microbacterium sp. TaxID=51671 RepID=UPI0025D43D45|nr:hypothetical protein [Microbacterium sp.]